jgi:hypothetical protein
LPAPGAAETRNEPLDHARIATSARSCHSRSDVVGGRVVGSGTGRGMLRHRPDGTAMPVHERDRGRS